MENLALLDVIIERHKGHEDELIAAMQEAQDVCGCLSEPVMKKLSEGLDVPMSKIYGVATFYSQFSLTPRGQHVIGVCLGTACYVRGAQKVLDELCKQLGVNVGETTADGVFTLNATRCLGACGLAPVMMIDDTVYSALTPDKIPGILAKYKA